MSNMIWTSTPPTVPGWYWWRCGLDDCEPLVLNVIDDGNDTGFLEADGRPVEEITAEGGQWAGPIEPPKETGG